MSHLRVTVSGIRNRTHVVYVASWLRHAVSLHVGSVTLVEINGAGRIADEIGRGDGLLANMGVQLVEEHPTTSGAHFFVSIGSPSVRSWARFRFSPSAWPLRTIVVDEGIGSYGSAATTRAAMRREGAVEPWVTLRALGRTAARHLLPDEHWRLYERHGDVWSVNEAVSSEFRRAAPTRQFPDRIVFLTQPWVDHRLIGESDYVAHLEEVGAQVGKAGAEFVIRPHPTEPAGRYGSFHVLESTLPAEFDPGVLGARLVLGETSTALLNLAAVHGLPAARVVGPLAKVGSIALSDSQAALFSHFVPCSVTVEEIEAVVRNSES